VPLGTEVNLSTGDIVLDGVTAAGWLVGWLRGPAVEHRSLADVLSLSCVRLVADG